MDFDPTNALHAFDFVDMWLTMDFIISLKVAHRFDIIYTSVFNASQIIQLISIPYFSSHFNTIR